MQRVNEYRFYELGQKLQQIKSITDETNYQDALMPLWWAREAIDSLLDDPLKLRVCGPVARELHKAITDIVPENFSEAVQRTRVTKVEGQPDKVPTVGYEAFELDTVLKKFEPVLAAECAAMDTYVISQKRIHSTPHLVDAAEGMLSAEALSALNPAVIADIRAAGRCLAFDTPTAAGFHVLRAVEAVMALYYTHITGRQLKKQHRNWGLYLLRLGKVQSASDKIIGALQHIKDNYRNPITHPDITLTEGEAMMLFSLSISVIELMADVMRTLPPTLTELEELKAMTAVAEQNLPDPDDL